MASYVDPKTVVAVSGDPSSVLLTKSTAEVLEERWAERVRGDDRLNNLCLDIMDLAHASEADGHRAWQILRRAYEMGFNDGGTDGVDRGMRGTVHNVLEAVKERLMGGPLATGNVLDRAEQAIAQRVAQSLPRPAR